MNTLKVEIRITGPCASGKSVLAHGIARALRRIGMVDVTFENVDPRRKDVSLHPVQMDAAVLIREGMGGQPVRDEPREKPWLRDGAEEHSPFKYHGPI